MADYHGSLERKSCLYNTWNNAKESECGLFVDHVEIPTHINNVFSEPEKSFELASSTTTKFHSDYMLCL